MLFIKYLIFLVFIITGCAQSPYPRPPDYKPDISKSDIKDFGLAINALKSNSASEAEILFKNLADDNPDISGPWLNLGLIYFNNNELSKSKQAANRALELNARNPYALNLLGMLASKEGEFKLAHTLYTKAISYKNDYAIAHYNLALLYDIYYQDIKAAISHYNHYLTLIDSNDKRTVDWLEQIKNTRGKS